MEEILETLKKRHPSHPLSVKWIKNPEVIWDQRLDG